MRKKTYSKVSAAALCMLAAAYTPMAFAQWLPEAEDSDLEDVVSPHDPPPEPAEAVRIAPGPYQIPPLTAVLYKNSIFYSTPKIWPFSFYDQGGEGAAYHDTTLGNAGGYLRQEDVDLYFSGQLLPPQHFVGKFATGEWLKYTTYVETPGGYDPNFIWPHELVAYVKYAAPEAANNRQIGFALTPAGAPNPGTPATFHTFPETGAPGEFQVRRVRTGIRKTIRDFVSQQPHHLWISARLGGGIDLNSMRTHLWPTPAATSPTGRRPVYVEDAFATSPGTTLHNRQFCAATYCKWTASNGMQIGADRHATSGNAGVVSATLTWPNAADPGAEGSTATRRVSAQLKLGGANWLAVGFARAPGANFLTDGAVYVQIRPNRTYQIFANGQTYNLTGGERPIPSQANFDVAKFNLVEMVVFSTSTPGFDQDERACSGYLMINGHRINWELTFCALGSPEFDIPLNYPGWAGRNMLLNQSKVDSFIVESDY